MLSRKMFSFRVKYELRFLASNLAIKLIDSMANRISEVVESYSSFILYYNDQSVL
jgi:hypothetical protein